jgi:hypothetical protein
MPQENSPPIPHECSLRLARAGVGPGGPYVRAAVGEALGLPDGDASGEAEAVAEVVGLAFGVAVEPGGYVT